ncbi:AraC family transcriptional activator of tynA and feaB [Amorphus sp. MBR-141]
MASQSKGPALDRASPPGNGAIDVGPGGPTERSTCGIQPKERLDYWRHAVLHRAEPLIPAEETRSSGRMTHIAGRDCDFVDHASDAIHARRDLRRLRRDDCDEIIVSLVGRGGFTHYSHLIRHKLRDGDLCVSDVSRPIEPDRPRHRDITLTFRRARLAELLDGDVSTLAGKVLPRNGMSALLSSHMRLLALEAARLSPAERAAALEAAAQMALLALQAVLRRPAEPERFPHGLYAAALAVIRQECRAPDLDPAAVAIALGCSRATLYRIFAGREASVSETIWGERLEHACRILTAPEQAGDYISDIAFRCGFIDMPTFNRMFKRRFGRTPGEMRHQSGAPAEPAEPHA